MFRRCNLNKLKKTLNTLENTRFFIIIKTINFTNFFRESEQNLNEMVSRDFALLSAVEVGQVFIKNEHLFHFLEEPNLLKFLVYFLCLVKITSKGWCDFRERGDLQR